MGHRNAAKGPPRRRTIAVLVAFGLILPLLTGAIPTGQATVIAPTGISVVASTDNAGLGTGPAVPAVLVQAGAPFTLTVSLTPDGATFNKDTPLNLTPTLAAGGSPSGSFSPSQITFPENVSSQSFSVSYSAVDNGVQLTASVGAKGKPSGLTSKPTDPFDVLLTVLPLAKGNPQFASGVGVGNDACGSNTTEPECGIVVLPNDIESSKAALSLGKCTTDLKCTSGSQVVQFIADLGTRYTSDAPATLIFRCSKQLCRNTNNGIRSFTLKVSLSAVGPLNDVSPPCADKGIVNTGATFCTDYVQSHRDNTGALLLYLLFTHDMRGST
jgi:hypothetical protein